MALMSPISLERKMGLGQKSQERVGWGKGSDGGDPEASRLADVVRINP